MDNDDQAGNVVAQEAALPATPHPSWCWQGLISIGLLGAWTAYLLSFATQSAKNLPPVFLTHCLVMLASLLFAGLELRKLFRDRDTTPGLMLALAAIGWALALTYVYLKSYGLPVDDCCHGA